MKRWPHIRIAIDRDATEAARNKSCCSSCARGLPCGSTEKLKKELRQGARSPEADEVRRRIAQMPPGPIQRRARELLLRAVPAPSRVESLVRQVLAPSIAWGSEAPHDERGS